MCKLGSVPAAAVSWVREGEKIRNNSLVEGGVGARDRGGGRYVVRVVRLGGDTMLSTLTLTRAEGEAVTVDKTLDIVLTVEVNQAI